MGWSDEVVAYRLWRAMSERGTVQLELLDLDQRRVAREMTARGLVQAEAGELTQVRGPLERWKGLA